MKSFGTSRLILQTSVLGLALSTISAPSLGLFAQSYPTRSMGTARVSQSQIEFIFKSRISNEAELASLRSLSDSDLKSRDMVRDVAGNIYRNERFTSEIPGPNLDTAYFVAQKVYMDQSGRLRFMDSAAINTAMDPYVGDYVTESKIEVWREFSPSMIATLEAQGYRFQRHPQFPERIIGMTEPGAAAPGFTGSLQITPPSTPGSSLHMSGNLGNNGLNNGGVGAITSADLQRTLDWLNQGGASGAGAGAQGPAFNANLNTSGQGAQQGPAFNANLNTGNQGAGNQPNFNGNLNAGNQGGAGAQGPNFNANLNTGAQGGAAGGASPSWNDTLAWLGAGGAGAGAQGPAFNANLNTSGQGAQQGPAFNANLNTGNQGAGNQPNFNGNLNAGNQGGAGAQGPNFNANLNNGAQAGAQGPGFNANLNTGAQGGAAGGVSPSWNDTLAWLGAGGAGTGAQGAGAQGPAFNANLNTNGQGAQQAPTFNANLNTANQGAGNQPNFNANLNTGNQGGAGFQAPNTSFNYNGTMGAGMGGIPNDTLTWLGVAGPSQGSSPQGASNAQSNFQFGGNLPQGSGAQSNMNAQMSFPNLSGNGSGFMISSGSGTGGVDYLNSLFNSYDASIVNSQFYADRQTDISFKLYTLDMMYHMMGYDIVGKGNIKNLSDIQNSRGHVVQEINGVKYALTRVKNGRSNGVDNWVVTRELTYGDGSKQYRLASPGEHFLFVEMAKARLAAAEASNDRDGIEDWKKLLRNLENRNSMTYNNEYYSDVRAKWLDQSLSFRPAAGTAYNMQWGPGGWSFTTGQGGSVTPAPSSNVDLQTSILARAFQIHEGLFPQAMTNQERTDAVRAWLLEIHAGKASTGDQNLDNQIRALIDGKTPSAPAGSVSPAAPAAPAAQATGARQVIILAAGIDPITGKQLYRMSVYVGAQLVDRKTITEDDVTIDPSGKLVLRSENPAGVAPAAPASPTAPAAPACQAGTGCPTPSPAPTPAAPAANVRRELTGMTFTNFGSENQVLGTESFTVEPGIADSAASQFVTENGSQLELLKMR